MSSSLVHTLVPHVVSAAAEAEGDPPIPAWAVGAIALGILLALLVALIVFGGGREHS